MVTTIREHEQLKTIGGYDKKYSQLKLLKWCYPVWRNGDVEDEDSWGYYASFKIGAEWIDEDNAVVVTTKDRMENIDFMGMFMTCFSSDLAVESFSEIYTIDWDKKAIDAPALKSIMSPLIVFHFIGVVCRIKRLKRGYVHHNENLKKVRGHIDILKNERKNIALKRYDRIYCKYDAYSEDIAENRLVKKALLFSQRLLQSMGEGHQSYGRIRGMLAKSLSMFEGVSDVVEMNEVRLIKTHKLFKEYAEAVRLAKLILRHFDYSINNVVKTNAAVVPFTLDMSLLYEHYVYGLLHEAYGDRITYQFSGATGKPDFLYRDDMGYRAILDTKYIPKYEDKRLDTYVVRQLSGYGRDLKILNYLGYGVNEESMVRDVPCVIIYPEEEGDANGVRNPFLGKRLGELSKVERGFSRFYKIVVTLPTIE